MIRSLKILILFISIFSSHLSNAVSQRFEFKGEIQRPTCSLKQVATVKLDNIDMATLSSNLKSRPFEFSIDFFDCPIDENVSILMSFQADTYEGIPNKIKPTKQSDKSKYGIGVYFKNEPIHLNTISPNKIIESKNKNEFKLPLTARLEVLDRDKIAPGDFEAILNFSVFYE